MGGSGARKSTLIATKILWSLGGKILLDGIASDKFKFKQLKSQIGLISQDSAILQLPLKKIQKGENRW